jgi:putative Mg2+ transporter-C (MgtC) family protein
VAAWLLALPLGWERSTQGTVGVGRRTLPLVALGACAWLLVSRYLFERGVFDADGQARALRAMMSGIGFIGGGAILKSGPQVHGVAGVATAATVWAAGAIGAATAHGQYMVAVSLTFMSLLAISLSDWLGARGDVDDPGRREPR